ncbi:MAG TPA: M20/M25/M40 family metallo-hydrolase [Firmicutes bacterium]|nr:M20/M25/M40 family metallo-hydrolase [Bacillota bacterium]
MKRICALLLCLSLVSPAVAGAPAAWPDWAREALGWGQEMSISGEFLNAPAEDVTRGMAAQLLYEAAGRPAVSQECPFSDVSGAYRDAITWAADQGYLLGVGEGAYEPDRLVTRQEFAAILWRRAQSPTVAAQGLDRYQDASAVAEWARGAVLWCIQTEVMNGREEGLAPGGTISVAEALLMLQRAHELPDVSGIQADLEALTARHRPVGSQGEAAAVEYLQQRFEQMGYRVTLQPYTDSQGRQGNNVIAVKEASAPNGDILVLSAHHDSVPTAYGANDNASGVAALLRAAEALRQEETDTEIRFISFTDEENGKNGSRAYTASLTEEEKGRMIGAIQFDMLGGLGSGSGLVGTMDGEANWLSDLLQEQDPGLERRAETASDHASFQLAGVPAVLLMQQDRGYLYHSSADTAGQLDLYAIAGAADTATAAARQIAGGKTGSYQQLAREQGAGYTYRQTRQNVIYFSSSLADTEAYIGAAGELVDTYEVSGDGWTDVYQRYRYAMRWFDGEAPMNTNYVYRNGFLERIEIRPEETGYTADQVRQLIGAMYGEPTREEAGETSWADPIYSKYITLSAAEKGCLVTVGNYSVGITNVLASYPVSGGQAAISDPEDRAVWDYLCAILPLEARQKIGEFNLYTDGTSNVLAYTSPMKDGETTDNTRFSISVDYYDVYDENGNKRDWSKLTYTILHEYGHVLLEDETQVDLSLGSGTHDPACFIEGSFRKAFHDTFWSHLGDTGVGDYDKDPTRYVSRYGANYFHEDIADTFAVFVLGGEPQGDTVAEEKVRFFWQDPAMTALRAAIRQNLGLDWPR